jgi:hypothetical protein
MNHEADNAALDARVAPEDELTSDDVAEMHSADADKRRRWAEIAETLAEQFAQY